MSTALVTLTNKLAARFDMDGAGDELVSVLKATAFKGNASDAQMTALMIVANQYGLNPWTKEIYAFPDKNNGIVPVVGVEGWSRIINEHPQFDGLEFEQTDTECACIIYRKDRSKPTRVTEYKDECSRNTGPWQSHPKRMLRHKSLIQCARLAFGYTGIYDQDEAERIVEGTVINGTADRVPEPPPYPQDAFEKALAKWRESGTKSPEDFAAMLSTKGKLSEAQKAEIAKGRVIEQPEMSMYAQVKAKLEKSDGIDVLELAADLIGEVTDPAQRTELTELFRQRRDEMGA
jgi:phage recombination protein Bet